MEAERVSSSAMLCTCRWRSDTSVDMSRVDSKRLVSRFSCSPSTASSLWTPLRRVKALSISDLSMDSWAVIGRSLC